MFKCPWTLTRDTAIRFAVPCAQTRVAIGCTLEQMVQSAARFERPCWACRPRATKPLVKRETMSVICHSVVVNLTFNRAERECHHMAITVVCLSSCYTCIEECGLQSNRFKVHTATCTNSWQLGRWYCLDFLWAYYNTIYELNTILWVTHAY